MKTAVFFLFFASGTALASPAFPDAVRSELGLGAAPRCTLCHLSESGGTGTVVTPFGRSMMRFGARAGDATSIVNALAASRAQAVDSDADGVPDVTELLRGTDPNDGPGRDLAGPEYGCEVGRRAGYQQLGFAVLIGILLILRCTSASSRHRR